MYIQAKFTIMATIMCPTGPPVRGGGHRVTTQIWGWYNHGRPPSTEQRLKILPDEKNAL